ncbi:Uncharacterised protein [Mycobacterium tuberculosis]|nr:Uncharacterised protein [Mycobacterium tuberculosis]
MVGFGAGAAQQCQPALGVAAIGGDAGQVEQRQRPLGVHRLGRQQLTFGRLDITDPVQRDRAQPAHRHPRRARHLGLQHLGEQAQRGRPAGVGAHRLCHQQLGQQRVGQRRPNVAEQIDQRVGAGFRRGLGGCGEHIPRQLVRVGCFEQQRHRLVQFDQRVQRDRVVGVEVVAKGQQFASVLETPSVEIESARC